MNEQGIAAWVGWSCSAFYGKTWKNLLSLEYSEWRKVGYNCWEKMRRDLEGMVREMRMKEIFSFEGGKLTVMTPGVDVVE